MLKTIESTEEFNKVIQSDLVVVDFYADWCGPCKMLAPQLEQFSETTGVEVHKVNVEHFPEVAQQYGILSIPNVLVFKKGEVANSSVGYAPAEHFVELIK